ncbi:hypothetical protein PQX77_006808 [Marasmius sp. AFHP31]|nr:hypothetical protein PQX77_006808 [Marasmius sp. AFHP31]
MAARRKFKLPVVEETPPDRKTLKRRYREKNRDVLNSKARERMAKLVSSTLPRSPLLTNIGFHCRHLFNFRLRAKRSETEKIAAQVQQKEWSHQSYVRNRDQILDRAAETRKSAFIATYGHRQLDKYPERDVRPRSLLEMKDDPMRSARYPKALWRWKRGRGHRRQEKQNDLIDREIDRREEERWRLGLDELC